MMVTGFSLPEDIIAEILPRLPAKSLLKFKSVSKSWCSFISSKYLVKAQLKHARRAPLADRGTVLIMTYEDNDQYGLWRFPVSNLFSQQKIQDVPGFGEYFILWNPTTGLSYRLPPVLDEKTKYYTAQFGFGYDESNDDYKVLVVKFNYISGRLECLCRLYSLKANSWKTVDDFTDFAYYYEDQATHLNGKLHWTKKTGENSFDIVTYDLGSETAGSFEQPFSGSIEARHTLPLSVIQGCLVVCKKTKCSKGRGLVTYTRQVSIMKEYGVKESLCKLMTLSHKSEYNNQMYGSEFSIICMSAVGEILFILESKLYLYNPKTKTYVRALRHLNRDIYKHFSDSAIYVETLVSPFPHGTKLDEPK